MGALHPGHLSLVDRARARAGAVAVSIFVNPIQFGEGEDLAHYPRDLEGDLALLVPRGVRLVFAPQVEEMYSGGSPLVQVVPGVLGDRLCGRFRPGHFSGVLTVVAKLFGLFRPDWAVFGRKDLQQAVLIERMVTDLEMGVAIDIAPLVRESDGLAMSSRNRYLSAEERLRSLALVGALTAADEVFRSGARTREEILAAASSVLAREPDLQVQYLDLVDPRLLDSIAVAEVGSVVALAVFSGKTRLIDNLVLGASDPDPIYSEDVA
jgi:pantoate--beta-alanine ligase